MEYFSFFSALPFRQFLTLCIHGFNNHHSSLEMTIDINQLNIKLSKKCTQLVLLVNIYGFKHKEEDQTKKLEKIKTR